MALCALAACSSEETTEIMGTGSGETTAEVGKVIFSVGGSKAQTRANGGEQLKESAVLQTEEEKKVTSLLAVVFADKEGGVVVGTNDQEADDDVFYKAIDVLETNGETELQENKAYEIIIGETNHYHLCFVANASETLRTSIYGLAGMTVKDFKALVETQYPETKPMLMTSDKFYGVDATATDNRQLGTIHLQRAMARIDIVNAAEGFTVTAVTLKNRTKQTLLINDAATFTDSYKEASKAYSMNLVGDPDKRGGKEGDENAYLSQIYSYEQYGTDTNVPTLDITYKMSGSSATYTHTVKFKKEDQPLQLKRNNLYRIILTNKNAGLNFTLTVADWVDGGIFEVVQQSIAEGLDPKPDYSNVQIGDIMLKDGTLVPKDTPLQEEQKTQAIGIVCLLGTDEKMQQDVKDKGWTHGLVLALKNSENGEQENWGTSTGTGFDNTGSGYTKCWENRDNKDMPAIWNAMRWTAAKPLDTSGWYLPSKDEWEALSAALGGNGTDIDEMMKNAVGGGNYDSIICAHGFWSSSEIDAGKTWDANMSAEKLTWAESPNSSGSQLRCVLAF